MECSFCKRNVGDIDFLDTTLLKRYTSSLEKIRPKKKTGVCASHQRKLSRAIKRARHMALLPFTSK